MISKPNNSPNNDIAAPISISINSGLLITVKVIMFERLNVRYSVPIKQMPQKKAKTKAHFPISFWYARKKRNDHDG